MKLHLIYNPNRKGPEVRVHLAGCRDIGRDLKGATSDYTTEAPSAQAAAEDFHADFIDEGSMTAADARAYTEFLPCTKGLPEDDAPVKLHLVPELEAAALDAGEDPAAAAHFAEQGPATACIRCGHPFPRPRRSGVCNSRAACDRRATVAVSAASAKGLTRTDPPPLVRAVTDEHLAEAHGPILTRGDLEAAEAEHAGAACFPDPAPYYLTPTRQFIVERTDMRLVAKTARVNGMRPCDGDGIYLLVRNSQGRTISWVPGDRAGGRLKGRTMADAWADVGALGVPVADLVTITAEMADKVRKGMQSK
jgi:hypothetical protein